MKEVKRFDMSMPPKNIKWYLKPITKLLYMPAIKKYKPNITKIGTEGIKLDKKNQYFY